MRKPLQNRRWFVFACILGCLSLSAVKVQGQNTAPAIPTPFPAPTATAPAAPVAAAPGGEVPAWVQLAAILGSVFGLVAMGLATWILMEKGRTDSALIRIDEQQANLNSEMPKLRARIPGPNDVERFICVQLGTDYNETEPPGYSIQQAINDRARNQAMEFANQEIAPRLQSLETFSASTHEYVQGMSGHFEERDAELTGVVTEVDNRTASLKAAFDKLEKETRNELEAFIFNMYNLVFSQSEGDPVVPKLEHAIERYQKLLDDLRAIPPHETTRLTMREFEEALSKLEDRLATARHALSEAGQVEVEPLPYLDEKERGRAAELLEGQRLKLRAHTARAKESLDDLRDAVVELYKPLQTLWMGASVEDVDQPEYTRSCRTLLDDIKSIFRAAGVEVYEAPVGGEIDTKMVAYKFAGQPHEAPFIAQKVTKLGLKVEDRIEQGAVVVA